MAENAIVVEGLRKNFGTVEALRGVDLTVPKGSVLGLLGQNGAGKTTLVRILATLLTPDSGRAWVEGCDVMADAHGVRTRIGLTGQFAAVDDILTGRENLVMVGRLYHLSPTEARRRADDLLRQFNLMDAADRQLQTYSGGMRRRLDIALSLINRPAVLFLDEPTTGLDPASRLELWGAIRELVSGGTTLLLTTQYLEEADQLADRIAVIDQGRVISSGTPAEIKRAVGGDMLSLQLAHPAETRAAAAALAGMGKGEIRMDAEQGHLQLPVGDGAGSTVRAIRALDNANIEIADLHLRRPTLDEAFLKLVNNRDQNHASKS